MTCKLLNKIMSHITNVPLPRWSQLFKAIFHRKDLDQSFFKKWTDSENEIFLFSRSAWSLYFIALCRKEFKNKESIVMWVPDYFCNATLAPLRELKVNLVFYKIQSDGHPDLCFCLNLLKSNPSPDIVLASHYFGRLMDFKDFFGNFRSTDCWLVEDAAHILIPHDSVGRYSDFTFYSPHKFLAIPDGAILQIKKKSELLSSSHLDLIKDFHKNFIDSHGENNISSYLWILKRFLQKLGVRKKFLLKEMDQDELVLSSRKFLKPKISKISEILLSFQGDLYEELQIRKENYEAWRLVLNSFGLNGQEVFSDSINISPYLFGLTFDDDAAYEKALDILIKNEIPISTWPDLPPEVINSKEVYGESIKLRLNSIFFPIHNSLSEVIIGNSLKKKDLQ